MNVSSPLLYPLWRIGWLERAFFALCRKRGFKTETLFSDGNFGHDVSYYQLEINFQAMQQAGAQHLICRAAYGDRQDVRFDEYMRNSLGVLPQSVYGFYDPLKHPSTQAQALIAACAPYKSNIKRVWLDMEFWWDGAYKAPQWWKVYRDTIRSAGYKTGWYTRATWWDSRVGTFVDEFSSGDQPVWAAQYNYALTLIPKGWTAAMLWQKGVVPVNYVGSGEIDYNLWNTDFLMADEWGSVEPPPPGGIMDTGRVKTFTNIRTSPPGGSYQDVGDLQANDIVVASEIRNVNGYLWWKLAEWSRNGVKLNLPAAECWAYGVNIEKIVTTPPAPSSTVIEISYNESNTVTGVKVDGANWIKQ